MRRALLVLVAGLALASPALAAAPRTSMNDIEDEVMCPICGTALGLSNSPQAEREKAFIQRRIDRGQSKQQIKDALVAEYGPEVLSTPSGHGFDLAAWIVPGLAIALAAIGIALGVRRWRRAGGEPREPLAPEPSPADAARLDEDLARYDL